MGLRGMKLTPLASGSSGNSFLLQCNGMSLLVDAGLSGKQMTERLDEVGCNPGALRGILVSHGHSDHVKGLGVLSRKFKLPIFVNAGTWQVISRTVGKPHQLEFFETGKVFELAGFRIHPFSVPHDCAAPVGFRISMGTSGVGIATDLGSVTGLIIALLQGLQVVVLESNHDPIMLRDGPYPWELKQRVKSRLGHLSNGESARSLQRIVSDELQSIVLAHMSTTNNTMQLALDCARSSLAEFVDRKGAIFCAAQNEVGPTIEW